jgi:hypothetical protein
MDCPSEISYSEQLEACRYEYTILAGPRKRDNAKSIRYVKKLIIPLRK